MAQSSKGGGLKVGLQGHLQTGQLSRATANIQLSSSRMVLLR